MENQAGPTWDWADRLRKIRRSVAGMSQAQMAALVGVKPPTYSAWEGGRNQPSLRTAYTVAQIIEQTFPGKVSAGWVLGLDAIDAASESLLPRMDSNHQPCDWRPHNGNALLGNVFGSVTLRPPSQ